MLFIAGNINITYDPNGSNKGHKMATINNSLTRQGTAKDVAEYFDINDIKSRVYSQDQLRAVVSASWMCQKVVGNIPKEMVNVQFGLTLTGQPGKNRSIQDLTLIQEQLRRLMPWFGETQRRANIVGKAYLLIDVDSVDPILSNIEAEESPEEALINDEEDQRYFDTSISTTIDSSAFVNEVPLERLMERFPYSLPLDWSAFSNVQISGADVLDGDVYEFDSKNRFLMKKFAASTTGVVTSGNGVDVRATLNKWYNQDPDGDTNTTELIHRSHVIEFLAFDYQEPKNSNGNDSKFDKDLRKTSCGSTASFRLTRFIDALLYYQSFINATLNRVHRSEFLSYQKENLGDTNLEIARAMASNPSHPSAPPNIIDSSAAITDELNTIANSALNLGVVLTDTTSNMTMLSRSFSGLNNIHDVFRPIIIGASGLTEFTLFGLTMASAGLNSHDVRDRMAISGQVDILFRDSWQPIIEKLSNQVAQSYQFPVNAYLAVKASTSFKLTELEIADVLDKLVDTRIKLVELGVISREELRAELKGDGLLGKYFIISEPDKTTEKEITRNDELLESSPMVNKNTSNSSNAQTSPSPKIQTSTDKVKVNGKIKINS